MNLFITLIKIAVIICILLAIIKLPDLIKKITTKFVDGKQEQKQEQQTIVVEPWKIKLLEDSPLYRRYLAQAMVSAVREYHEQCGLQKPGDLLGHLAPYGKGVHYDEQLGIIFVYQFSRTIELNKEGRYANTTISVNDMASQLNQVIGNYTIGVNWHPLRIVLQGSERLGRVFFCLAPFTYGKVFDYDAFNGYIDEYIVEINTESM